MKIAVELTLMLIGAGVGIGIGLLPGKWPWAGLACLMVLAVLVYAPK